ncbi:MAG TPA: glucodextranase DOMON-like domain-containing protein, partial [Mycobacteriales bacterium]|nr:glucodextranase DOMON-like domain-containing protein [Mycobacteriales bacterium]
AGGAIGGRTAAWLHGADSTEQDAPVEVVLPREAAYAPRDGLRVRRALLTGEDVVEVDGIPVTTAVRTAFDLARLEPLVEAVTGVDALVHAGAVTAAEVEAYAAACRGWRGVRRCADALGHVDGAAESPMESRLRMLLVLDGLPRPVVNQPLHDAYGCFLARPDLRIEHVLVEYDGSVHRDRDQFDRDLRRQNRLVNAGFTVLRYTAADVYRRPALVAAQVRRALLSGPPHPADLEVRCGGHRRVAAPFLKIGEEGGIAGVGMTVCDAGVTRMRAVVVAAAGLVAIGGLPGLALPAQAAVAEGAPGAVSHFDLARKDCVGTARNTTSKVWYTVADGVLSDVYSPTVDNTNVETLQYVVTDGATFTDLQTRDMTYTVQAIDPGGLACRVTSTPRRGGYRLVTDYLTDPARDAVVMRTRLEGPTSLKVFVRYDATVNGNGGGGAGNAGADDASVDPATTALVSSDTNTVTNAVNRDYAVPLHGALRADRPFRSASSGYAGTASDGLTQLDTARALSGPTDAPDGNVVQTAEIDRSGSTPFTLALGYGTTAARAIDVAGAAARTSFALTYASYAAGWVAYDAGLKPPLGALPGLTAAESLRLRRAYYLSLNVIKASEDKTFPGAIVAGLGAPWGQAVSAGDPIDGKAPFNGSYRTIFGRDLYESVSGLLTAGDVATARAATRFLFERQQLADGRMPRNSLVNGLRGPESGGDQLDETAYPILMAWETGLAGDAALWPRIRLAADFVVARGPSFGSERWEEQGGYSPSTIAAEIAGLVAAGRIADRQGDPAAARVYRATADHFQRSVKGWTVTTSGPYADRYFIRLSRNGDPDAAVSYNLGNGGPDADQRSVVDAGFLELTRLGILPANDPDVLASLPVVDAVIKRDTASGPGWYRYGTATPGTEDGYGDCWEPDPTSCAPSGKPWPTGGNGSGHVWPVLSGERAEQQLQTGDRAGAARLLASLDRYASGVGLIPEQAWENPDLPASPYGTAPETASIGFVNGESVGSTSPLTWAQAQLARLVLSVGAGRPVEQPAIVADRYVRSGPPGLAPLTVTAPADGTSVTTPSVEVTGTTAPGATVDVVSTPLDIPGETARVTVTAGPDGAFAATVPAPFGSSAVTVAATTAAGATGYARRTVISDNVTGTTVLDVTDPDGDDFGPGTYAYPTSSNFQPGAFDLQRFQVIVNGDTTLLRAKIRNLAPTFGSPLGAQLLDVYVHDPAATATSTAAAFPNRNYSIEADSAWSRRIEVEGFADPVFVDASGAPLGTATVLASQASGYITILVPTAALGTVGPGWRFTVVLHGQDGFAAGRARGFQPTPQDFQFGVCAPGGTSPICAVDPATVPKAMDVITPPGVDQAAELNPLDPPVQITGVAVPA